MKIKYTTFLALFFFCLPAFAWNAMGHRIIAEIAYTHLDSKAQQRATELIDYLGDAYPYSSSFQTASTWMDSLRGHGVNTFNDWHFINTPLTQNSKKMPQNMNMHNNVVWALDQSINVLKTTQSNQYEKALFLRFLLHLTGDVHQPLHTATRFTEAFPAGDEGGNLFLLTGEPVSNLHADWDRGLGFFDDQCPLSFNKSRQAKCLAAKIEQDYPPAFFREQVENLDPHRWANESFLIAKSFAYQTAENQPLSNMYRQQGQKMVEQRLALAGYRLAGLLNQLFG